MSAVPPLEGDALLEAVTDTMVAFHEKYHHRRPRHVRTQLMQGDLLACVLGDVYTAVEQTLIEMQRSTLVNEARSAFQDAMGPTLIREVERLSGRRVALFFSATHIGPDLEVEVFLLGEPV